MGRSSVRSRVSVLVASVGLTVVPLSPASASPSTQPKLTAAAGTADAKFGISVSIEGNTAVVGAPDEGGEPTSSQVVQ